MQGFLARDAPGDVRHVNHAVDVAGQADEQAELGRILNFALDHRADGVCFGEGTPRVRLRLLEAQRNAALLAVDLEDDDLDLLAGRNDLAGVDVLRSEERRVGKEGVSPCSFGWSRRHKKKKKTEK